MSEEISKHTQLADAGIQWLHGNGCSIFAKEVETWNGRADALGMKPDGTVYYIEAKASRSDLICKKQKTCYRRSAEAEKMLTMGYVPSYQYRNDVDFYYYIVADGIKVEAELYPNWGVISEAGIVVRRAKRMQKVDTFHSIPKSIAQALVYKVYGKLYL